MPRSRTAPRPLVQLFGAQAGHVRLGVRRVPRRPIGAPVMVQTVFEIES